MMRQWCCKSRIGLNIAHRSNKYEEAGLLPLDWRVIPSEDATEE